MIEGQAATNYNAAVFCWYGLLAMAMLLPFASLSHEVERALHACEKALDADAWKVVWKAFHVNFVIFLLAGIAVGATCVEIYRDEAGAWRGFAALSILACGGYISYTRSCEKKMIAFLTGLAIYPRFRVGDRRSS